MFTQYIKIKMALVFRNCQFLDGRVGFWEGAIQFFFIVMLCDMMDIVAVDGRGWVAVDGRIIF